jgi:hypothetical protein
MPRISSLRRDRADDRYRRPRGWGAASVTPGAAHAASLRTVRLSPRSNRLLFVDIRALDRVDRPSDHFVVPNDVRNPASGPCLEVYSDSTSQDATIEAWQRSGGYANKKWRSTLFGPAGRADGSPSRTRILTWSG